MNFKKNQVEQQGKKVSPSLHLIVHPIESELF